MKKILKKFTWKQVVLGITVFVLLKIIGNWGWAQDFYTGLFVALGIFIFNMISAFRKSEKGIEEFSKYSEKKKKVTLIFVYISCVFCTLFLIPIFITFTIPLFGIVLSMIKAVFMFFRNPALGHILFLMLGWFIGIIYLIITLVFLVAIAFLWGYAFDLKKERQKSDYSEPFEEKRKRFVLYLLMFLLLFNYYFFKKRYIKGIYRPFSFSKIDLSVLVERVEENFQKKRLWLRLKMFIRSGKKAISFPPKWIGYTIYRPINLAIFNIKKLYSILIQFKKSNKIFFRFTETWIPILFWIAILLTSIAYYFYKIDLFYFLTILIIIGAIFLSLSGSFKNSDILAFQLGMNEIKKLPRELKNIWAVAKDTLFFTIFLCLLYILFVEKIKIKGLNYILITRIGLVFLNLFVLVFCVSFIIHGINKIISSRNSEALKARSLMLILIGGFYKYLIVESIGRIIFYLFVCLGFISALFLIGYYLKEMKGKEIKVSMTNFINLFGKSFCVILLTAVIFQIVLNFFMGMLPGSEASSKECSAHFYTGVKNFLKSTQVRDEFIVQVTKKSEDAEFLKIINVYKNDQQMQKSVRAFLDLKESSERGMKRTWHRFNKFSLYKLISNNMINMSDYMYKRVPIVLNVVLRKSEQLKKNFELFNLKLIRKLKESSNMRDTFRIRIKAKKILLNFINCNNKYESLKPRWLWQIIPNQGVDQKLFLNIESKLWIFLFYKPIKERYKDDYVVVKRRQITATGKNLNLDSLSNKYGDISTFDWDQKILIYTGLGRLKQNL